MHIYIKIKESLSKEMLKKFYMYDSFLEKTQNKFKNFNNIDNNISPTIKTLKFNGFNEDFRKYKMEEKAILSIPLIDNKTVHQMRKFYRNVKPLSIEKIEKINFNNSKDLVLKSIKNPINKEKIYKLISMNRMSNIGVNNFSHFVNSMKGND